MEVSIALEVKLHARTLEDGQLIPMPLKKKEDNTINAMVQRRIGELQAEIQTYLTLTRGTDDSPTKKIQQEVVTQ